MEEPQQYQSNVYLEQVLAQKAQVENDLKAKRAPQLPVSRTRSAAGDGREGPPYANNVRITGWWPFQNVIVPPNVYVVHTRRGYKEPLHIGLGISFRFDPVNDAFLIVPATMQTILIHANCICREKQGLVVQGYVQWIINDIKTAYRKLDFSDAYDPMRVINVQLREQAEAAIKDKVATMSIDEVLTDKQPIIEELTSRLRHVAEGEGQDKGLGLSIVTVQIKEAVVCSSTLWEMLQRPFRSERKKEARLAELENEAIIRARESEAKKADAKLRIETAEEIAGLEAQTEAARFDRHQSELIRRASVEAETIEKTMEHEKAKIKHDAELEKLRLEKELAVRQMKLDSDHRQAIREVELFTERQKVENEISEHALQKHMLNHLPEIAEKLPKPSELKTISLGSNFPLLDLIANLKSILGIGHGKNE
ncbi:MAG: SPFH domain-containing protein [Candidatus Eremiobacterota bacterium]